MNTSLEKKFIKLIQTAQDIFFDDNLTAEIKEVSELKSYNMIFEDDYQKKSFIIAILHAALDELAPTPKGEQYVNIRCIQ